MKFSGLKISAQKYAYGDIAAIENKQRLSLSSHAYTTLLQDLDLFRPAPNRPEAIPSDFINHIFSNFHSQADSSIAAARRNERIRLQDLLAGMTDPQARQEAVGLLLKAYSAELKQMQARRRQEKDHTFTFRISRKNIDFLLSDEGQQEGAEYGDNVGAYFKALLEEYCELPYARRELIFHSGFADEIQLAIQNRKLLRITTRNRHTAYVKPLALSQDSEQLYYYLVGLLASGPEGPWEISSVRLTSISDCQRQAHTAFISADTAKQIRSAIRERGIQYLAGAAASQRILVEFTPEGEKLYRTILHLRPQFTKKTGRVYEFHCSLRQASNYFFQFGHQARILEPESLAVMFKNKFRNAAGRYD